jgi:Fe-S-cluster containining protein
MGSCKKCGQCCRWSYFQFIDDVELTEILKLRGAELVDKKTLRVPLVCRFLNQETNLCLVYEGRPQECRDFPGKSLRPKECKYE